MAVTKRVEVRVLIDGQPVKEYCNPEADSFSPGVRSERVEKYIECVADKNFVIDLKALPGFVWTRNDVLKASIKMDGSEVAGNRFYKNRSANFSYRSTSEGKIVRIEGERYLKKYRFGTLQYDDGPEIKQSANDELASIGTIEVAIYRGKRPSSSRPEKRSIKDVAAKDSSIDAKSLADSEDTQPAISEKALKGQVKDLYTRLDAGQKISLGTSVPVTYERSPIAMFKFSYLSQDGLQKLGIIERPRSPTPLEDRDFDSLTDAEKRILYERTKATLEAEKRIKKELMDNSAKYSASAKRRREDTTSDNDELQVVKKSRPQPKIEEVIELDD